MKNKIKIDASRIEKMADSCHTDCNYILCRS